MNKYFIANGMISYLDEVTADQHFLPLQKTCNLLNKLDSELTQLKDENRGLEAFNRNTTTDTEVLGLIKLAKQQAIKDLLDELENYIICNCRYDMKRNRCIMDITLLFEIMGEVQKDLKKDE